MARGEKVTKHEYVLTLTPDDAGLLSRALFHIGISDKDFGTGSDAEEAYDALSDHLSHIYEALQGLCPPTGKYDELRFEIVD
jgi:hypothetical protein